MRFSASRAAALGIVAMTATSPVLSAPVDIDFATVPSSSAMYLTSSLSTLAGEFSHYFLTSRLVQTSPDAQPFRATEAYKAWLRYRGVNFFDVTDHADPDAFVSAAVASGQAGKPTYPTKAHFQSELKGVFANISDAGPKANLHDFTSFRTRYYRSETGKQSQRWLLNKVKEITADYDFTSVSEHPHSWGQNSIILLIKGTNNPKSGRYITVLGAHQDSTNLLPFLAAPGADDDGSGTVTLLETVRALLTAGWRPETDVEVMWYSAEEGGLLGSQDVVKTYVANGRADKVKGMLQQDMTAFVKAGTDPVVGVVADFVDPDLTAFLRDVIVKEYLDIPPVETKLGYAGSDHASWNKASVPSAFLIEATFNDSNLKRIHTTGDVYDIPEFSWEHLLQFVRLSAATAVELGGWSK